MALPQSMKQTITNLTTSISNIIDRKIADHDTHASSNNFGHVKSGGVPQSIGSSLSAGTDNGYYARADHVHTASYNNLTDKPIIPVAFSTVPNADTSSGSIGSSDTWAKADHTHPMSPFYVTPNHTHSNYVNISDVRHLCLPDEDIPNSFKKNCVHSVTYDNSSNYTQIRMNDSVNGSGYYLLIPFYAPSNNFSISVDFYTTGMTNDDFGIRVCDKKVMDETGAFNSYGAWIITGQSRLAYGYGGRETNSVLYGDRLGSVDNNVNYHYIFRLNDNQAYYCLINLDTNTIVSERTCARTDSYTFSGAYYFYIGGGKFTTGSNDKSVFFKNLTIQENCMTPYPIGSIYMSIDSTNPSNLFGGIWERIEDTFLLASGSTYANGDTGGSADAVVVEHNHTQEEHDHTVKYYDYSSTGTSNGIRRDKHSSSASPKTQTVPSKAPTIYSTGVDGTGMNMPPYLAVYVWKRVA